MQGERLPQVSAISLQPAARFGGGHACSEHDERNAKTAGLSERAFCFRGAGTSGLFEDSQTSCTQLLIGHAKVQHPVIVNAPEADHGCSAEHVQNQFLGCACLHACRTGNHLRTRLRSDGDMCPAASG